MAFHVQAMLSSDEWKQVRIERGQRRWQEAGCPSRKNGQHAQDYVRFEGRPCVTLIAATSTQRGDTGDEHEDHVTLELSQRNPTTAPGNKALSHRTSGTRYFRCKKSKENSVDGSIWKTDFATVTKLLKKKSACVPLCPMRGSVSISVSQPS